MRTHLPSGSCGLVLTLLLVAAQPAHADTLTCQVTGLFMQERQEDLRAAVAEIPDVKLVRVDFDTAQAVFEFDRAKAFPGAKPEQVLQRLDQLVRNASRHTFTLKPLSQFPRDKLQKVEIEIVGLDCKACSFGAYLIVYQLEGVEWAAASFKEGRVRALIDPAKTDKAKLIAALKKREVDVRSAP